LTLKSSTGNITLARIQNKSTTASSIASTATKPTITRIVKLSVPTAGQGAKTQIVKAVQAVGQGISTSSNQPKIIKVTPEQFAALKAGII